MGIHRLSNINVTNYALKHIKHLSIVHGEPLEKSVTSLSLK